MKYTKREGGKRVVVEVPNTHHNPPCRTERCKRRNAKKGK